MSEHFNGSSVVAEIQTLDFILFHNDILLTKYIMVCTTETTKSLSMFEHLARDYYHLDNKWCCCYEIKCSHNRIESSAKPKYKYK